MSKRKKHANQPGISGKAKRPMLSAINGKASASSGQKAIGWLEWALAISLTLLLVILHCILLLKSGGLWRDEVEVVNLVSLSSLADIWENLQFTSFPLLWLLIVRAWVFIGFGGTDLALRALGLIVGLGTVGAFWYTGRALGMRLPMISLVLFAMSPAAFVGDSLRAYGLGVVLILLSLGTMWRVFQTPTLRRMLISASLAILSVQCLYHNSFLILAICLGASTVGIFRRNWKLTAFPILAGALAAVSVLPYFWVALRPWDIVATVPVTLSWLLSQFQRAIDPSGNLLVWIWSMLGLAAVGSFVWSLFALSQHHHEEQRGMALFLLTTMAMSIISYIIFLKILSYPTQSWYYLPIMAVLVVIMDKGIDTLCDRYSYGRIFRAALILCVAIFVFGNAWIAANTRRTNIDVVAAKLEVLADKDDLIVVNPFYYGLSFARYYKGSTIWTTLPEIDDHGRHRYDLIKSKMAEKASVDPLTQKMVTTLQQGKRVWLVGELDFLPHGKAPMGLPPAPYSVYGWSLAAYEKSWSEQAAFALQTHGQILEHIPIPVDGPVNRFESVPLRSVRGWRP